VALAFAARNPFLTHTERLKRRGILVLVIDETKGKLVSIGLIFRIIPTNFHFSKFASSFKYKFQNKEDGKVAKGKRKLDTFLVFGGYIQEEDAGRRR